MSPQPFIFIGCSSEAKEAATALHTNLLDDGYDVEPWYWGTYDGSMQSTLAQLLARAPQYDLALIFLTPDDLSVERGQLSYAPRDNLLFELGLFVGVLGADRVIMITERDTPTKLPSDLAGIGHLTYPKPGKMTYQSALGGVYSRIKTHLDRLPIRTTALPTTLQRLSENWRRYVTANSTSSHPDRFKLYSFRGIIDEDEACSFHSDHALEYLYSMWADASAGSAIKAQVISAEDPRLRISFDNQPGGYPSDVLIRVCGRHLAFQDGGFAALRFQARIPPDAALDDLTAVQLGLRVIDALATQWIVAERENYRAFRVQRRAQSEWVDFLVPLKNSPRENWRVFEADGNALYHDEIPDFSMILGVAFEFGCVDRLRPGCGKGVVELRAFDLA